MRSSVIALGIAAVAATVGLSPRPRGERSAAEDGMRWRAVDRQELKPINVAAMARCPDLGCRPRCARTTSATRPARCSLRGEHPIDEILEIEDGCDPSTIRNALLSVRAIYRRALIRGDVALNPTTLLELPAVRGRRERTASPEEFDRLVALVPVEDRPVWRTAYYAGLRLGELQALRFEISISTATSRRSASSEAGIRAKV
jgi:integrase